MYPSSPPRTIYQFLLPPARHHAPINRQRHHVNDAPPRNPTMALSRDAPRCSLLLLPFLFIAALLLLSRRSLPRPVSLSVFSVLSAPPHQIPLPQQSPPLPEPAAPPPEPEPEVTRLAESEAEPAAGGSDVEPEPSAESDPDPDPDPAAAMPEKEADTTLPEQKAGGGKCDLYQGRWEEDEEGRYPLYAPGSCPYVDEAYACQDNGRPDSGYTKWRWRPDHCELPRFNATDFLERLRGKKLLLVGDSMNRNQFESILCLLREALPDKSRMYETRGYKITKGRGYFIFFFVDYDCTVMFVRSHFLVKEGVRVNPQGSSRPILSIDRIDKSANRWKKADILVFNTGHWWAHGKTARGKDYYQEGGVIYPKFDAVEAFKRAMRTWGRWIDKNMDPHKKLVFYRGYSTAHFRGGDWDSGGTCNKETEPIKSGAFLDNYPVKMTIIEDVIAKMRFPVILLNITKMTNFRKDAHPSVYGKNLPEGQKVSRRRQDCSHWCLPGVPDAWNELIYASLILGEHGPGK